jgi:hypothetical protein
MSNVIIEELIELTAAAEDVSPMFVRYVLDEQFDNDVDNVEEATQAAAIAVKAGLTYEQLTGLAEWAYERDGEALFNFIGAEYFLIWEKDAATQYKLLTTGKHEEEGERVYTMKEIVELFDESYYGYYESDKHFAEIYTTETANEGEKEILDRLDTAGAIDWKQLWDNTLTHDWYMVGGHYYREV